MMRVATPDTPPRPLVPYVSPANGSPPLVPGAGTDTTYAPRTLTQDAANDIPSYMAWLMRFDQECAAQAARTNATFIQPDGGLVPMGSADLAAMSANLHQLTASAAASFHARPAPRGCEALAEAYGRILDSYAERTVVNEQTMARCAPLMSHPSNLEGGNPGMPASANDQRECESAFAEFKRAESEAREAQPRWREAASAEWLHVRDANPGMNIPDYQIKL